MCDHRNTIFAHGVLTCRGCSAWCRAEFKVGEDPKPLGGWSFDRLGKVEAERKSRRVERMNGGSDDGNG